MAENKATPSPDAPKGEQPGPSGGTTGKEPTAHPSLGGPVSNVPTTHPMAPPPTHTAAGAPLLAVKDEPLGEATKKLDPVSEANARYTGTANPPPLSQIEQFEQQAPVQTSTHTKKA